MPLIISPDVAFLPSSLRSSNLIIFCLFSVKTICEKARKFYVPTLAKIMEKLRALINKENFWKYAPRLLAFPPLASDCLSLPQI